MAMHESTFDVPREMAKSFKGLAIDAGSTLIKCVFRSKRETLNDVNDVNENPATDDKAESKFVRLQLLSFPYSQIAEGLERVRQQADITREGDEPPTLCVTGVRTSLVHSKQIADTLQIRLNNVFELDCCVAAFVFLATHLSRSEFLYPAIHDDVRQSVSQIESWNRAMSAAVSGGWLNGGGKNLENAIRRVLDRASRADAGDKVISDKALADAEPDAFPCLFVMLGTASGTIEVHRDGTSQAVDVLCCSSRTFYSLGQLLTDAKSFDELVELASKGNEKNVDLYSEHLADDQTGERQDNIYDSLTASTSILVSSFGQANYRNKDSLKPEDKARALLDLVVVETVQRVLSLSQLRHIKRVFFGGSFCNNVYIRRVIAKEFVYRMLYQMTLFEDDWYAEHDFIRPEGYLGALGCLLKDVSTST